MEEEHAGVAAPRPARASHVTKSPAAHRLSAQTLTKCFFRNSLVLKAIHLSWGCTLH
jgi:hypothetical protein